MAALMAMPTALDAGGGAYIRTLGCGCGGQTPANCPWCYGPATGSPPWTEVVGGTIGRAWPTGVDLSACDFSMMVDTPAGVAGSGKGYEMALEYATLGPTQNCGDGSGGTGDQYAPASWATVPVGTIMETARSLTVDGIAVNVTAPACLRVRMSYLNSPIANRQGGMILLHCRQPNGQGVAHYQGASSGSTLTPATGWWGGNVARTRPEQSQPWWMHAGGTPLRSCSGVVALSTPPGAGATWSVELLSTVRAPVGAEACFDLPTQTTGTVCTISGPTQLGCHITPTAVDIPSGACLTYRGTCTAGSCASHSNPNIGLDCTSDTPGGTVYSSAGSGAPTNAHGLGAGRLGLSDCVISPLHCCGNASVDPERYPPPDNPQCYTGDVSMRYWQAPATGLSDLGAWLILHRPLCAGNYLTTPKCGGSGAPVDGFRLSVLVSNAAPTEAQSCASPELWVGAPVYGPYCTMVGGACAPVPSPTPPCSTAPLGAKSCVFPAQPISVPPRHCFTIAVSEVGDVSVARDDSWNEPQYGTEFNWGVSAVAGGFVPLPTPSVTPSPATLTAPELL